MKARIHHGAHEIGGNCVEVEHDGYRLVLDLGLPLTSSWNGEEVVTPQVDGFATQDPSLLGVLISHHHADHWGLVDRIGTDVPIYMGAATQRILAAAAFWTRGLDGPVAGHFEHRQPSRLGPFTVTPFLNDHSAYDAYSLLVEAGGRRLFYSGDIRGHGRKAAIFEQLLDKPPDDVHVLLLEGTNIQPGQPTKPTMSETDVEHALIDQFRTTAGLALVVSSAQNVDRLVTIYRAALQAGRDLAVDPYTADVARATGNNNIPRPGPRWPRIHTYMPRWQSLRIKSSQQFERLEHINPYRLYPEQLAADPSRYVLLFHRSEGQRLAKAGALDNATCTWSLWSGYLDEPSGQRLTSFLADLNIELTQHHTSGHATITDLRRLATAIDPERVVPIHTSASTSYSDLHPNIDIQPDGQWWDV